MQEIGLNELPDVVLELIKNEPCLPIVIIWNNDIMFQEVYRAIRHKLKNALGSFQEHGERATFYIKDYPVITFCRDPEFSRRFSAKTVIDISVYQKLLECHLYNEERQIAVEALAAHSGAKALRVRP